MNKPKRTRHEKGITLIALIITIVVLLILAVVAIRAVQGDGIIQHAKNAQNKTNLAQDEEQIKLALNEWKIVSNTNPSKTFVGFMEEKFGTNKVTANGEDEVTVTLANGNQYKVKEDGTITSTKGIVLSTSKVTLELNEGTSAPQTITARLNGIEGKISWSNSDNSKATISAETGESITVTAVAKGGTTITATCGGYTAACTVTVEEPIPIGSYVQYNVPYTDIFSGVEYTENNGWRYLGKDDNENYLIISTGVPGVLWYGSEPFTKPEWWATDTEVQANNGIYHTNVGWEYNNGGEPGKYVAYGLRYKFESIPFTYQESGTDVSTANTGIFRKVGTITSGSLPSTAFRASGVNVVDVHNLTLAELNRATNKATRPEGTRPDSDTGVGFKELTGTSSGLFDIQAISGDSASYWLATPGTRDNRNVFHSATWFNDVEGGADFIFGVRPVVTLSPDANLTIINN